MFKQIAAKLKELQRLAKQTQLPPDLSQFNDPLAETIEWTPCQSGGTNIRTHKLVQMGATRVEFRPTAGAVTFFLIFLLIGLGITVGCSIALLAQNSFQWGLLFPIGIGLLFTFIGGAMLYSGTAPIVFDSVSGYFWKGRKDPRQVFNIREIKHCAKLADIHALQILSEYCRGDKSSYYSYELNLVLHDGSRLNVIDHGNLPKLREDAQRLADFLNKPIWDIAIKRS